MPFYNKYHINLTGEEGKEEHEKDVSIFPVMGRSTAHQKGSEYIDGDGLR